MEKGNYDDTSGLGMGQGPGDPGQGIANMGSSTLNHLLSTPSAYSHLYNQVPSNPHGLPGFGMNQPMRGPGAGMGMNMNMMGYGGPVSGGPMSMPGPPSSMQMQMQQMSGYPGNQGKQPAYNMGMGTGSSNPRQMQMEDWTPPPGHPSHFPPGMAQSQPMPPNFQDGRMDYVAGAMGGMGPGGIQGPGNASMPGGIGGPPPPPAPSASPGRSKGPKKGRSRGANAAANGEGSGNAVGGPQPAPRSSTQQLQQQVLQQMQQQPPPPPPSSAKRNRQQQISPTGSGTSEGPFEVSSLTN